MLGLLEQQIENPSLRLPEEMFLFNTKIAPMINGDLFIRNDQTHTLLTWREDGIGLPEWHTSRESVRFKERMADPIAAVVGTEVGAPVTFKHKPLATNEVMQPSRKVQGCLISLLFDCHLREPPDQIRKYHRKSVASTWRPYPGKWAWPAQCPDNLIPDHEMYQGFTDGAGH